MRGVDPAVLGDYLARAEAFGFSGAVVVAAGDSALVSAGFGLADRVRRIPVTVSTPFYVASLSKQFTAAAIMRLEMAGKLGTRDTLGRFFAALPPAAARITLHQLLTHTAGTPRGGGRETDPEAYVRRLFAVPLRAAPGTAYAYSNEGYGILAAVIQKVSGRSYGAFLREQLFAPAGMGDSYDLADAPPGLATRAYRGAVDMGDVRLSLGDTVPWDERAGRGIVTTAADLWRWGARAPQPRHPGRQREAEDVHRRARGLRIRMGDRAYAARHRLHPARRAHLPAGMERAVPPVSRRRRDPRRPLQHLPPRAARTDRGGRSRPPALRRRGAHAARGAPRRGE